MENITNHIPDSAPPSASKPSGRPAFHAGQEQLSPVRAMAACGISRKQITVLFGISPTTLRKYFRAQLDLAAIELNARLFRSLQVAAAGCCTGVRTHPSIQPAKAASPSLFRRGVFSAFGALYVIGAKNPLPNAPFSTGKNSKKNGGCCNNQTPLPSLVATPKRRQLRNWQYTNTRLLRSQLISAASLRRITA
jgi:hypothetical protein